MLTILEKKLIEESIIKSITTKRNIEKVFKLLDSAFGEGYCFHIKDENIIAIDNTIFELANKINEKYGYSHDKYPLSGLISDELCYWLYNSNESPEVIAQKIIELLDEDI